MAELASIDHLFNAPSSSVHRIQEAKTTIHNVPWELTLAALCRPSWRDDRQLAGEPRDHGLVQRHDAGAGKHWTSLGAWSPAHCGRVCARLHVRNVMNECGLAAVTEDVELIARSAASCRHHAVACLWGSTCIRSPTRASACSLRITGAW